MELPSYLDDLPKDEKYVTICNGGGMSLIAVEIMNDRGFEDVKSLAGGIKKWSKKQFPLIIVDPMDIPEDSAGESKDQDPQRVLASDKKYSGEIHYTVDARGFTCPRPILMSKKALNNLNIGQVLEILTTDPGSLSDIPSWLHVTNQELLALEERGPKDFRFIAKRVK
jgi:tRNA 2-thiouridine synthesizing protein A